ncbi:MAG: isoaspartyl peptidase/L-asparaginase [Caulobacter sp.]|nr:isoaspartyl peptidase/L-asparaginase [Caulobacter sp.]
MRRVLLAIVAAGLFAAPAAAPAAAQAPKPRWAIVIHGGAGVIERDSMDAATEAAYRAAMGRALAEGQGVLAKGGSALDAVEATIRVMEDDPLFNAGRGAVFTAEGRNELDAAIMDGASLKAGSVAGVTRTRNPISLARAVMERSRHVMLAGDGADQFSKSAGLEQVDPAWFFTERRWEGLEKELNAQKLPIPTRPPNAPAPGKLISQGPQPDDHRFGTVGVVALDSRGDIAAGTSTGGMTAKRWGRVGDAPIIGAGTYADNRSCAVSATGSGEYFIRLTVARTICALVQYKGLSLQDAANQVVQRDLPMIGGDGGVIALTADGQLAWSYNTPGMYRARASSEAPAVVAIYKDEP